MKRILMVAAVVLVAGGLAPVAAADNDPFPSTKAPAVFVSAQTVTTDGAVSNWFAPGSTVVFRAYAVDAKKHRALAAKAVRYFYVKIPGQPNVKLRYGPKSPGASGLYTWTGAWAVPADYAAGVVPYKVLVKTRNKRLGSFVQMPIATALLTISATPQTPLGAGPAATPQPTGNLDLGLYVDTVNGSRPTGAAPRPIGCTQTNVYKRGEQVVVRAWGFDLSTNALLTNDNVTEAHFSVPGQPNVTLNWGAHGAVGHKVFFWASAWIVPKDYPLGDVTLQVSFKTTTGKTGTFDYRLTIIP